MTVRAAPDPATLEGRAASDSDSTAAELVARVPRNALYNLAGQSALLLLGFAAARFIFKGLGDDAFGLILFATTLNAVLSNLLDLGLTATSVRVVAVHTSDRAYVVSYIRTATTFYWSAWILLSVSAYLAAPIVVTHWVRLSSLSSGQAAAGLWVLLAAAFSSLPRNLYSSLFRGLQRMEFNNLIDVATVGVQQSGVIVILVLGGGLMAVALWMLLVGALAVVAYVVALKFFFPLRAFIPGCSSRVIADQWRYAGSVAWTSLLSTIFMQSDKLVVSKLLPLAAFGYYTFTWNAAWRVAALAAVVGQAAFPSLAVMLRAGSGARAVHQFERLQTLVSYASAVPIAALAFAALPAFGYLFGASVAVKLLLPALLLGLAYYMNATLTMPLAAAVASGRPEIPARLNMIAAVTFLPALIGLVAWLGLTGAGLAWLGYYMLAYGYLVPRVCRDCVGVSALAWYRRIARVVLLAAATYGLAWPFCYLLFSSDPFAWAIGFTAATCAFGAGALHSSSWGRGAAWRGRKA